MSAVGYAVLPTTISIGGLSQELQKQVLEPTRQAAKQAAESIEKGIGQAVQSASKDVTRAQQQQEKAAQAVAKAEQDVVKAKQATEQATAKVQIAELEREKAVSQASSKLAKAEADYQKLLDSGKASVEQLAQAEAKITQARLQGEADVLKKETALGQARQKSVDAAAGLENAEKGLQGARDKVEQSSENLTAAEKRLKDAHAGTSDQVVDSTDKLDKYGESAGLFGENMGKAMAVASAAVAGAALAVGSALVGIGTDFDDMYDTIRVGTGASGDAFAGLQDSARAVAAEIPAMDGGFEQIGTTLADLNTRLGLTGEPLETMTAQFVQLQNLGIDADINDVTGALTQFGVSAEDAPASLDMLFQISQATGRTITELTGNLSKSGPALQEFGFGLEESAGLLGALDKAGLDSEKTLQSMTKAMTGFIKDGRDPQTALWETISAIEELTHAGERQEALDLAESVFGPRGRDSFIKAVESGQFAYDDFLDSIGATEDTILGVASETADFAESWQLFKQKAMLAVEPVATMLFDQLAPAIEKGATAFEDLVGWVTDDLIPAMQDLGAWFQRNEEWIKPLAVTVGVLTAGYVALAAQQSIMAAGGFLKWMGSLSAITKVQTAAQAALNVVMAANPIALVAIAVAGLTAGLVYFFTQTETGRELWGKFTTALSDGWNRAVGALSAGWEWIRDNVFNPLAAFTTGTVLPVLQGAWEGIKYAWDGLVEGIKWAYENIIKPVFDGLVTVGQYAAGILLTVVLAPLLLAWEALSAGISWGWENVIKPAWDALVAAGQWMWDMILQPVFGAITAAWEALGSGVRWVWENVIKVAWDAVAAGALYLWETALRPVFDLISAAWRALADGVQWVWENVIKTTWDTLSAALTFLYESVIKPTFQFIQDRWTDMGNALHATYQWVKSNVLDALTGALDTVKGWFDTTVDAIGVAWDKLRALTAKPVRFVVETVYGGIRTAWNKVAGLVGLDELPEVPLGNLGAYARGGVLPGYSPGRDNMTFVEERTGMRLGLSGGESIMVPEWTQMVGGPAAVERMNQAARSGGPIGKHDRHDAAYAAGGVIGAMIEIVKQKYPMLTMTDGYRAGANDMHGRGLATDWSNGTGNTPQQLALAHDIARTYPGSAELIYDSPGWAGNIKNGKNVGPFGQFYTMEQAGPHHHHVHWAMTVPPTTPFGGGVFEGGSDGFFGGVVQSLRSRTADIIDGVMNPIISSIPAFPGTIGKLPRVMAETLTSKVTDFIGNRADSYQPAGGSAGSAESWREMAVAAMRRNGFNADDPAQVDAMLKQIMSESGGNPGIAQQIHDMNGTGDAAGVGLLQIIPGTFATYRDPSLPNDRRDPWANMNAALRYYKARYGTDLTTMWGHGHGYAHGGLAGYGQGLLHKTAIEPEMVLNPAMTKAFIDWMKVIPGSESAQVIAKELTSAFEGIDWGYSELARVLGREDWAHAIIDGVATLGRFQRGFHDWARATEDQDRMGTPAEWAQHFGGQWLASTADDLLGLVGLDGIIGGRLRPSLVNLINTGADNLNDVYGTRFEHIDGSILAPPSILDDEGRAIGTRLERTPDPVDPAAAAAGVGEPSPTTVTATPAKKEVVIQVEGDAVTTEKVEEIAEKLSGEIDGVTVRVQKLESGQTASVTSGITGIA